MLDVESPPDAEEPVVPPTPPNGAAQARSRVLAPLSCSRSRLAAPTPTHEQGINKIRFRFIAKKQNKKHFPFTPSGSASLQSSQRKNQHFFLLQNEGTQTLNDTAILITPVTHQLTFHNISKIT